MDKKQTNSVLSIVIHVVIIVIVILVIYTVGKNAFAFGARVFDDQSMDSEKNAREVEVTIPANITNNKLASLLVSKGLVEDELVFVVQVQLSDYNGKFQAGTYTLNTGMNAEEIMEALCNTNKTEASIEP